MSVRKQNLIWRIVFIFVCLFLAPFIVLNLIIGIQGAMKSDELPSVFGIHPTVVGSGSMSPTFEGGDLIFIKHVNIDDLRAKTADYEGDVICFYTGKDFITHRIIDIKVIDGVKHLYTAGDVTGAQDSGSVTVDNLQGQYIGRIANFGEFIMFVQSPSGLVLTMILLLLLYLTGEAILEILEKKYIIKNLQADLAARDAQIAALKATQSIEGTDNEDGLSEQPSEESSELPSEESSELPSEEVSVAPDVEEAPVEEAPEASELDADGVSISSKYRRSFMSRLIQGGDPLQSLYSAAKNYLLQYTGVRDRISWDCETFSYKRNPLVKLCVRGKTLYAYLALTEEETASLQVDGVMETNKFLATPARIKISGTIKLRRVFRAIDAIAARLGLESVGIPEKSYTFTYKTDRQLINRGLIKINHRTFTLPTAPAEDSEATDPPVESSEISVSAEGSPEA